MGIIEERGSRLGLAILQGCLAKVVIMDLLKIFLDWNILFLIYFNMERKDLFDF
jgi:hypothetical protein